MQINTAKTSRIAFDFNLLASNNGQFDRY